MLRLETAERTILYVGRLSPEKGCVRLLDSMIKHGRGWRLEFWGEGPLRPTLEKIIDANGVRPRVAVCGVTDDMAAVYCRGRIVVVPSCNEGLPNAMIEAILCGCRVVVADGLSGAIELLKNIGLFECVVTGDFETGLIETVERVCSQTEAIWCDARKRLAALTDPPTVARQICQFVFGG